MGFGIDAGISRNTRYSVQTADKVGIVGQIEEFETFGGTVEVSTELYSDSITNTAVNGQTGTTIAAATIEHSFIESNTEYQRESKTTRQALTQPV